jgi:hypothetical protein
VMPICREGGRHSFRQNAHSPVANPTIVQSMAGGTGCPSVFFNLFGILICFWYAWSFVLSCPGVA